MSIPLRAITHAITEFEFHMYKNRSGARRAVIMVASDPALRHALSRSARCTQPVRVRHGTPSRSPLLQVLPVDPFDPRLPQIRGDRGADGRPESVLSDLVAKAVVSWLVSMDVRGWPSRVVSVAG